MTERGPDDEGFFTVGALGIGMRRLSIIDVDGGHQPLTNEDGTLHLVLNGEIYNHVELREELRCRGHKFRTSSDAEVVLHLYEEKRAGALHLLNGMFAFALVDTIREVVWIARDRLGIKPLFYSVNSKGCSFASSINALREVVDTGVDRDVAVKYLAVGYAPGTETVWRGVQKLLPGHQMEVSRAGVRIDRYWNIDDVSPWTGTADAAREQLDALLMDSVRLQLRSDVQLGVFLSGGVDSSSIVALAASQVSDPLITLTVDFEAKDSEDPKFAAAVVQRYGTSHDVIPMGVAERRAAFDELVPIMDEPLSDSAALPAYWLSAAARRRGVKVLLNGAGGDEIFGGYRRHWPAQVGSPTWVAESVDDPIRSFVSSVWSRFQPGRGERAGDPAFSWMASVSGVSLPTLRWLLRDPKDFDAARAAIREEYNAQQVADRSAVDRRYARMKMDLEKYLPQNVLSLTDKATMAASVEGRVPLLDHRLVEFAFSLPPAVNLLDATPKGLFKAVMRDRLPSSLLARRKEGFNAPIHQWVFGDGGFDILAELQNEPTELVDDLVDVKSLPKVVNKLERSESAQTLFSVFMLNRWNRMHSYRRARENRRRHTSL